MSELDCKSELVLRERRGELSPSERVALEAHLVHCASCRIGRELGRDFDAEATLEPDDGARIARLSALAERWAVGSLTPARSVPSRRRGARIALFALAAAFAAVGASAATGTWSRIFDDDEASTASRAPLPAPPPKTPAAQRAPGAPRSAAAAPVDEREGTLPEPAARAARSPAVDTAASLFRQANEARRSGDSERAVVLYRRLVGEFPRSPEASLSGLPLGGLLLDRGQPRAALVQFDRAARSGRLLPEALYGRGRSLAALGDHADERRTWQALLEQFPNSPYAGHARRRLLDLK